MKQKVRFAKFAFIAVLAATMGTATVQGQTYTWSGAANTQFYNTSNWSSSPQGAILFDNAAFRIVRTNSQGQSPAINQWVDWQPGIFDHLGGNLSINADYQVYFNDFLNGNVTVNTGASFICRNIIRVGREGNGIVNLNGGTMRCQHESNWQGIFIGVLTNGNGTVNVNEGGLISGGYQVEIGTRDFYPTGTLNVNTGGTSEAYWTTVVGPNGTLNVNGGNVNTGQALIIGDLFLDNAANVGPVGAVVGRVNINSGTVTVNHLDLDAPALLMHANSKVVVDNGTLRIKRTGVDFSATLNGFIGTGQIAPAAGKELRVSYDGVYTTLVATTVNSTAQLNKKAISIYPNPASDKLTISGQDLTENIEISIINVTGKTVLQQKLNTSVSTNIDISGIAAGVYIARIATGNETTTVKFIKK
jgi:hypothetical protein